ncbi:SSI family serine proteinase inhibitor [Paeniglutamicibacter sp. NPDC012692]|uniref:SSI family serine proteinase inhibitor n=1 Tax=Paeniglutamicibacter sp. NPDC012692 TaxID=3364388 RepID=UPI0036782CCD
MRIPVTATLFAAVVLLAGCGGNGGGPGQSSAPPTTSPSAPVATVDLDVVVRADGKTTSAEYSLQCAGATALETSKHPRAAEACELLAKHPQVLDPAPANQMCTEQYGGPATASVTGTVDGKAVAREFDLKNGCGISAWGDALPLLVEQPTGN